MFGRERTIVAFFADGNLGTIWPLQAVGFDHCIDLLNDCAHLLLRAHSYIWTCCIAWMNEYQSEEKIEILEQFYWTLDGGGGSGLVYIHLTRSKYHHAQFVYTQKKKKVERDETRDLTRRDPLIHQHDGHQAKSRRFHVETRHKANSLSAVSGDSKEQKNISRYRRRHLLFLWYTSSLPSTIHKGFFLKIL